MGLTIDPVTRGAQAGQVLEHTGDLGASDGIGNVSSFGLGADCEVYFLSWSAGELRRIVPAGGGSATGCPTPDPFLAAGGGVFSGGIWLPRNDPRVAGAGLGGGPPAGSGTGGGGGCTTAQPASGWVCVSGGWVPSGHPLAGLGSGAGGSGGGTGGGAGGNPGGAGGPANSVCTTVQPVSGWLCVNGGWLPPDHPLVGAGSGQPGGGGAGGPPAGGTGGAGSGCTTLQPASNWVCVNGGWVPPDHSLARGGGS